MARLPAANPLSSCISAPQSAEGPSRPDLYPREGREGAGKVCQRALQPSADKPGGMSGGGTKGPPPHPRFNSLADPGLSQGDGAASALLGERERQIHGAKRRGAGGPESSRGGVAPAAPVSPRESGRPQRARARPAAAGERSPAPRTSRRWEQELSCGRPALRRSSSTRNSWALKGPRGFPGSPRGSGTGGPKYA